MFRLVFTRTNPTVVKVLIRRPFTVAQPTLRYRSVVCSFNTLPPSLFPFARPTASLSIAAIRNTRACRPIFLRVHHHAIPLLGSRVLYVNAAFPTLRALAVFRQTKSPIRPNESLHTHFAVSVVRETVGKRIVGLFFAVPPISVEIFY